MREIDEALQGFSEEEKKLVIFRTFIETDSDAKARYILKNTIGKVDGVLRLYIVSLLVTALCQKNEAKTEAESLFDYDYDYQSLITDFVKLSKELKLDSSLELCELYTYMLWNGYFSKDKMMQYTPNGLNCVPNIASHLIMSGEGNCLSVNSMLTDILNRSGYDSAVLIATAKGKLKGYHPKIEMTSNPSSSELSNYISIKQWITQELFGNHAISLVSDNNGIYVFDAQNLGVYGLESNTKARNYDGRHILKLKPYLSFYLNDKDDNYKALSRFLSSTNYNLPCSKEDYEKVWEEQLELYNANAALLDDYHSAINYSIERINKKVEKAKELIKK